MENEALQPKRQLTRQLSQRHVPSAYRRLARNSARVPPLLSRIDVRLKLWAAIVDDENVDGPLLRLPVRPQMKSISQQSLQQRLHRVRRNLFSACIYGRDVETVRLGPLRLSTQLERKHAIGVSG